LLVDFETQEHFSSKYAFVQCNENPLDIPFNKVPVHYKLAYCENTTWRANDRDMGTFAPHRRLLSGCKNVPV
jgi:hypothetical protein